MYYPPFRGDKGGRVKQNKQNLVGKEYPALLSEIKSSKVTEMNDNINAYYKAKFIFRLQNQQ